MAFTKIGLDHLVNRIVNRKLVEEEIPWELDVNGLMVWFKGYSQCQNDILAIIKELGQDQLDV